MLHFFEPHALSCLLDEGANPFSLVHGLGVWKHLLQTSPDLPFFTLVGLAWWSRGPGRNRDLFVLTICLVVFTVMSAAKIGSDLNYFLGLRVIEAVFIGSLFGTAAPRSSSRLFALSLAVGTLLMAIGLNHGWERYLHARHVTRDLTTPLGQEMLHQYREVIDLGSRTDMQILTDTDVVALRQLDRAPFVDSFLFRLLVDSGRIEPRRMEQLLREEQYDLLVIGSSLVLRDEPGYQEQLFSLPDRVARVARAHYVPVARHGQFTLYRPRNGRFPEPEGG